MDAADVKAYFDEVARDWDTMRLTYYDERVIEQLAARTQLSGEQTVVDVGTGTGFVAAGLAAHAHRVLGFDNASSMLEVARANVDRLGVGNVELAEGDVADLPLPDHAVDATVANMVLHHATDPAAMLAEMTRVTRPGGWVAITDEIEHPYEWMRTEHADVWLGSQAIRSRASSAMPGCSTTATPHLAPSETSSPRLRSKSQTSGSSSRGVRCPRSRLGDRRRRSAPGELDLRRDVTAGRPADRSRQPPRRFLLKLLEPRGSSRHPAVPWSDAQPSYAHG